MPRISPVGLERGGSPPGSSARRILANAGFRTIADLGSKVASVVLYGVMARRLGDDGLGVFAFALSFVTLVTTFASFGYKTVLTREVARDRERVHAYFANTLVLQVALSLPVLAAVLALGPLLGFGRATQITVALLGLAVVAEAVMGTVFAVWQAWERLVYVPVVLISQRWVTAGVGVIALLAGARVEVVAAIYLGGALSALGLALALLYRRVVRPRLRVEPARWRSLLLAALPIGLAGVLATLAFRIDMTLLAAFQPTAVVGQYGAAYRLLESTLFISWSVGAAVYPVFARRGRASRDSVLPVLEGAFKLALALALPLAAGAAVLAEPVMRIIYGPGFDDGARALVLLAPAVALYPVGYVAEYLLVSQDRQRALVTAYAGVAAATLVLSLILIPMLSLDGAAIATSLSELAAAVVLVALSIRTTGTLDWRRIVAGPAIAAGASAATMFVLGGVPAGAIAAGAAAYVLVLWGFERRAFPDDARVVRDFVAGRFAPRAA